MDVQKPTVSFDDFSKIDLAVGKVTEVMDVPGSEKLYRMVVDFGSSGVKTIFAGLKSHVTKRQLKEKKFVFVTNLPPRKMPSYVKTPDGQARQEESQGMMLVVAQGDSYLVLPAPKNAKEGARLC